MRTPGPHSGTWVRPGPRPVGLADGPAYGGHQADPAAAYGNSAAAYGNPAAYGFVRDGATALDDRYPPDTGGFRDTGPARTAARMLDAASVQAADITERAWADAAAVRQAAERDAAAMRQHALDQAAAVRDAAQRDAAQMRAAVMAMAAELTRVSGYVAQNLAQPPSMWTVPPAPAFAPPRAFAPPPGAPAAAPAGSPAGPSPVAPARPGRPATRPARPARPDRPDARPARKPAGRQAKAGRKMTAALAILTLAGATVGATEIAQHGLAFFVFRANGAGASVTGLTEDQGPGQPNAPGAHRKPATHRTTATNPSPAPKPSPAGKASPAHKQP
jgi:hypothetical protein